MHAGELAGLEPTLWRDGRHDIIDVARELYGMGFQVNMTTHGSRLKKLPNRLPCAGFNKLRLPWHTLDPALYETITGGNHAEFMEGMTICEKMPFTLSFNRIFIRDLTKDIGEHIKIIDRQASRIKFLELYYTENNKSYYQHYHLDVQDFIKIANSIPELEREFSFRPAHSSRERYVWKTPNGGHIELRVLIK